jgi:hypothetical protein
MSLSGGRFRFFTISAIPAHCCYAHSRTLSEKCAGAEAILLEI